MSSRSPRGSVSGASSSAEIAADFEESLRDLQGNIRHEITNLTIIAKENTEHAQAISKALENYIRTTSPTRKLPALYVLDSIVKNVGTPYTVYLGQKLFNTFMDAYTLVDNNTRKAMEGMLKTWKERVPGSTDPRPVFPVEQVRPIETALIKHKTFTIQNQRQSQAAYRGTGTATPPHHQGQPLPSTNHPTPPMHMMQYSVQQSTPQQQHYPYAPPLDQTPDVSAIKTDIQALIPRFQQKVAADPSNFQMRKQQLSALEALYGLLGSRPLSVSELHAIRNQVTSLSAALPPMPVPLPTPQPAIATPQWQTPAPFPQTYPPPVPGYPVSQPVPSQQPTAAAPALAPDALSGLQALLANVQKPSTPQMRAAVPGFRDASHSQLNNIQNHAAATPAAGGASDLISSLAKAGLINSVVPPTSQASNVLPATVAPPPDPTASLLASLQSILPVPQNGTPAQAPAPLSSVSVQVPVSSASLKVFRPELIHALYDAQSNQCTTCGRRFQPTPEGREKKSRHLDWHFRTNQRIADPNTNRGHHRNWYVDEMEWIRHVEFDPSTTTANAADADIAAKSKKGPQDQSVRAPAGMTKNTCNICFEDMKTSYSDELQDWIFTNATVHNGKIVHATCWAEMTKPHLGAGANALAAALASANAGQRDRSATPDSLLGKRKAEGALGGGAARLRTE